jgi:putative N6-adenine-specific DNA methylase
VPPRAGAFSATRFEIFLSAAPGLEADLCAEVSEKGFTSPAVTTGGVTILGGWEDVLRANLEIRGAAHVLARLDSFHVDHLAQLDRRARQMPWGQVLRRDVPVRVEATCRRSRIYHSGAAAERFERAIAETLGAPVTKEAGVVVRVRIESDICTLAVDTSGEPLHRRGHKAAVSKAPMRETMASLLLRQCGYRGRETVVDPMCGSGTFVIEAAEIAAGLHPGRSRRFAFEDLATFDAAAWSRLKERAPVTVPALRFLGSDRDAGAVRMSRENAERAGVAALCLFEQVPVEDLEPPGGPPGLVIVNPPYGARIGEARRLAPLYRSLGRTLSQRFVGWRVGLIATDDGLARATGLPFLPPGPPVLHGGLRIRLYRAGQLGA